MFHTGGLFVYTLPQVIFGGTTISSGNSIRARVRLIRKRTGDDFRRRAGDVPR